jgi:hypothetical protein
MRKRGKSDANQQQIIDDLRKLGFSVCDIHSLGHGIPDIIVGKDGKEKKYNIIFEIKNDKMPPNKQKLTDDEIKWNKKWKGQVNTVKNVTEILEILNKYN